MTEPKAGFKQIASWRHLGVGVAIMIAIAAQGLMFQSKAGESRLPRGPMIYLSLILMELALIYLVWRGVKPTGTTLRDLIGGRWQSAADVLRDIALAFVLWLTLIGIALAWRAIAGGNGLPTSVAAMLPQTTAEIVMWIALSISAGAAEEIVFRGYLQRQFAALTGSSWIALVMQALLFGVSHGYQGIEAMLRITLLAIAFGLMALWRKSLRPGIIAHAWTDIASGVFPA
jgi:membrane protease YdiL (CAAX protease family)